MKVTLWPSISTQIVNVFISCICNFIMKSTVCVICLKIIKGKSNLNHHLFRIHVDVTDRYDNFRCPLCPIIFLEKNKKYMNTHINKDHQEDLRRLNATDENVRLVINKIITNVYHVPINN